MKYLKYLLPLMLLFIESVEAKYIGTVSERGFFMFNGKNEKIGPMPLQPNEIAKSHGGTAEDFSVLKDGVGVKVVAADRENEPDYSIDNKAFKTMSKKPSENQMATINYYNSTTAPILNLLIF